MRPEANLAAALRQQLQPPADEHVGNDATKSCVEGVHDGRRQRRLDKRPTLVPSELTARSAPRGVRPAGVSAPKPERCGKNHRHAGHDGRQDEQLPIMANPPCVRVEALLQARLYARMKALA